MDYYYALVDENGVLCVDRLQDDDHNNETTVVKLAEFYPDTVYFVVNNKIPEFRVSRNFDSLNPAPSNREDSP